MNREKERRAIQYLKTFEPESEPYYLCYSGGNSAHIDGLKFFDPGTDGDIRLLNALDWGYRGESK